MKKYINNIFQKINHNKTIVTNFGYLSALQIFSMFVPLITLPYLIRVLGKDVYGLVVFAQAVIGYLVVLINFGFNISSTKDLSVHRANKEKVSEIVSSTLLIKGIFFLFTLLAVKIILLFTPKAQGYETLFYLTMYLCLYEWIFPIWYFQGIEKMKYITLINVLSRSIFLALVFIFVKGPEHYLRVPMLYGLGAIIAGFTSLWIVFGKERIRFSFQPISTLWHYTRSSIPFFASNISTQLYTNTNKVILGVFTGMNEVAYYDLAEKISSLMRIPLNLIGQSIFPRNASEKNMDFIIRIMLYTVGITLVVMISIIVFAKVIVFTLGGIEMEPAINVTRLYILTILPISVSHFLGYQALVIFGYRYHFLKVISSAFMLYLILLLNLFIFKVITIYSLILCIISIRLFILSGMYYYCRKFKLL